MALLSRQISHSTKNPNFPVYLLFKTAILSSCSPFSSKCGERPFSLPYQSPPVTKKAPFAVSAHGRTWQDPFHWMRHVDNPDLADYLRQENSYAQDFMADTEALQRKLVSEMKSRMPTKVLTAPERWGPWVYYQYIPEGKEYPVLSRRFEPEQRGWVDSFLSVAKRGFRTEETLLDWNEVAEKYGYVHVGTCRISPDHNFLAYTLDTTGSEQFLLQIKDLRNHSIFPKVPVTGVVSVAWAEDGKTLFYTISDENQRPYRQTLVLCTNLGSDHMDAAAVFTEDDSSYCVDITSTKDGKFITVNSNSRTSSEVYVIDASKPEDGLRRICNRVAGVQYFLEHHHGLFYILTNASLTENTDSSTGDYVLARCAVNGTLSTDWQDILYPSDGISFQDLDIFNGHLVLFLNKRGCHMFCSIDLPIRLNCKEQMDIEKLNPWYFPVPSDLCSVSPGSNHDFAKSIYRVVLSSPVMPDVIVDYDMSKRTFSIVQQEEVQGVLDGMVSDQLTPENRQNQKNHDMEVHSWNHFSDLYCCERKEVISSDGVRVPLTILYSRKAWKSGESPGLLQGYGAYGETLEKVWCSDRLSLLDRGWVLAFADVRGGGGGDSSWHESGRGLLKKNSIHDFICSGKYLIDEGYVHSDQLAAIAFSAGGVLIGAAINTCSNLFRAAILKVPFLDIVNTLLDPSLPLSTMDYEEFGNPQIQSMFECLLSYSPYENIARGGCHPSVLVTASFNDSRVGVWEAAKWVARLRDIACPHCSRSVILKTNMTGGHFGEGGRYVQCEETSYDYAFLMKTMGLRDIHQ